MLQRMPKDKVRITSDRSCPMLLNDKRNHDEKPTAGNTLKVFERGG